MTEEDKPQNNPLLKIIVFLETFLITNGSCCKRFSYEKPFFFNSTSVLLTLSLHIYHHPETLFYIKYVRVYG